MSLILPWYGKYLLSNTPDCSNEDRLRQVITRAFDKAGEVGVFSGDDDETEYQVRELSDQLFDRILPFFDKDRPPNPEKGEVAAK